MNKQLVLEDGTVFKGEGFGADVSLSGEVVFNTGMTGYQEILSDPSYCDQIVTLTYPLIGNYGINRDDFESLAPMISGVIVREVEHEPSHWRKQESLHDLLVAKNIPGLAGIDTRMLTRKIRMHGTVRGRICDLTVDTTEVARMLREETPRRDQVARASAKTPYHVPGKGKRVALIDCGMKHGILQSLIERHCDVIVVPYNTPAEDILRLRADGVLVSNGPGDPTDIPETIETIKALLGKLPLFGICLGHQLLALACGATTSKLSFGHRGSNHPVRQLASGQIEITSQNHGYTVDVHSLMETNLEVTHVDVNDGTIEGLTHKSASAFSIQYHPEAAPGPHDAGYLFDEFLQLMVQHVETRREEVERICQSAQM
ncbi:carbamoyl phosphate synthase small subunit [Shouchella lonarensis]|uniref:Carbamoyl phosphate synthase small chain n=1 Tax=Shouchella lonarensis TaxID=1464122 RepID=A0A1G6L627_9BACI|nr:carbamoyl phosphate synthase small subunit [Shouchella lonarensis]SDC38627.1 carbamoyl-phosphate synthase small subunit [Shouchella lonarensis]